MRIRTSQVKHIQWILGILAVSMLTGCGAKDTEVSIVDGFTKTEVAVSAGTTVKEALEQAEITVQDQDVVSPQLDTVVKDQEEIQIQRHATITLTEGDKVKQLEMTGKCVQDVFDQEGIAILEHDYVNHSADAYLYDGMNVEVTHRLAVSIQVDGNKQECLTKATTVSELLEEQNIALDQKDIVKPGRERDLTEGMKVTVERVSVKEVVEKEKVPFETEVEYSNSMYSDETVEKTPGVEGEKEVTYQITYVDGKEDSRKALSENILKEPVAQVVTKGTKERKRIVSKQKIPDCDGSNHGYYIITWSDGKVEYQDY